MQRVTFDFRRIELKILAAAARRGVNSSRRRSFGKGPRISKFPDVPPAPLVPSLQPLAIHRGGSRSSSPRRLSPRPTSGVESFKVAGARIAQGHRRLQISLPVREHNANTPAARPRAGSPTPDYTQGQRPPRPRGQRPPDSRPTSGLFEVKRRRDRKTRGSIRARRADASIDRLCLRRRLPAPHPGARRREDARGRQ